MSAVILVPLLPLLAALLVMIGSERSQHQRAKIAAYPIGAAFLGAIATLWLVATAGAHHHSFLRPRFSRDAGLSHGFLYRPPERGHDGVDRRRRHHHLHLFHRLHVSGSPRSPVSGADRFHDLVLLCMVSSANLMMLFLFWQVLSYCSIFLPTTMPMRRRLRGRSEPLPSCGSAMWPFCPASFSPISSTARWSSKRSLPRPPNRQSRSRLWPGIEISGATAVTLLLFIGAMSKSAQFPDASSGCPVRSMPRRRCMRCCTPGSSMPAGF